MRVPFLVVLLLSAPAAFADPEKDELPKVVTPAMGGFSDDLDGGGDNRTVTTTNPAVAPQGGSDLKKPAQGACPNPKASPPDCKVPDLGNPDATATDTAITESVTERNTSSDPLTAKRSTNGGATGTIGAFLRDVTRTAQGAANQPIEPNVTYGQVLEFPPAKTPEAQKARDEYVRLSENGGDKQAAHDFVKKALESSPDDPALRAFAALSDPKKGGDSKTVKKRAAELLEGLRKQEDVPQDAPMLASPISFGAAGSAGAGAARAPLAGLFTKTPDLRALAVQREAGNKIGMKDYAGAESLLTRRIEEAPTDAGAYVFRALARNRMKRYADSADDARRANELEPRDKRALHLLSSDMTALGRPAEGVAEADRALQLDSRDAEAYVARAAAYAAMKRQAEQLADLERAAALDPQFDSLFREAVAASGGTVPPAKRSWPVWFGAVGTALLFFSFALFRKRGDSSLRVALRREDHDVAVAAAPKVAAVPKGFKVIKTLGQGGMGVVYEAMDLGLHRTVALKKLRAEIAENERERNRFLKEARTVAALKHPNIVEIHSIHEDAEGLFLVFERVPGESLHERLGKGPIPPAEAAAFLRQIASALDYAHQQGVVHQDLKPGNVMIHAGLAKVMDFGIARRVQETLSTMSKVEIAGTPAYMAPEQEQGVVGPSADVFALGACAYETLTGSLPYPTGGLMLKAQKMYRKPSEATPALKPAVDLAIGRALEPKPEDRWPNATSFVDALARALS